MTRQNATNFTAPLQFPYATAGTDVFMKEDVQILAQAVDQHNHTTGKGLPIAAGAIPNGSITSAMIADGTITGTDIAANTVTSNNILDGTIATADLANAAVTNAKLGTDTARLNLVTNGGFEIWQRGNGPYTATNAWTADRWQISLGGGSSISVSRDTTNVDASSQAAAAVSYTHSASSNIQQLQEGYLQLRGRTVTFSMRVRVATANAVRLGMWDSVNSYRYSSYHTGDGTYQTLTLTAPIAATTTACVVYVFFDASCTAYLDNAMLVVGSVAADYAPLHPADDLARCLRYYQQVFLPFAKTISSTALVSHASFLQKAVTPSVTLTAPLTFSDDVSANFTQSSAHIAANEITAIAIRANSQNFTGLPTAGTILGGVPTGGLVVLEANP